GLSFPQSAGFLFLVYGLCGAQRRIARDTRLDPLGDAPELLAETSERR
ncbi:MAG: hypothetical protein JWO10_1454, partial [Microbacteriaceae bacterium]|nr:hypothetical protein [Microbacteriaceae bacterium]